MGFITVKPYNSSDEAVTLWFPLDSPYANAMLNLAIQAQAANLQVDGAWCEDKPNKNKVLGGLWMNRIIEE